MDLKPLRAERGEGKVRTAWRSSGVCARHLTVVVVVVVSPETNRRIESLPPEDSQHTHTHRFSTYFTLPTLLERRQNKRYLALYPVSSLPYSYLSVDIHSFIPDGIVEVSLMRYVQ